MHCWRESLRSKAPNSPYQRTLWLGTMKAVGLGVSDPLSKNLHAAMNRMTSARAANRSTCLGSLPRWLIFQRIVLDLPNEVSNQCGCGAAVPGTCAFHLKAVRNGL